MSVAEERETSPNDSKDTTLAVSMSDLVDMSTSEMIVVVQDIGRLERGGAGDRVVMGVYQQRGCFIFRRMRGGEREVVTHLRRWPPSQEPEVKLWK